MDDNDKNNYRTIIMRFRVNPEERQVIKYNAGKQQVGPFVRDLALGKKSKRRAPPVNKELVREISKVGNNLNQIARHINTSKKSGLDVSAIELLSEIREIRSSLDEIWEEHHR
ncbi:MobC family plasmid mobilization relaxosome protein [Halomonas korlensis]|uniref:MobC family plasmid mobilization relaxosome protein n=1 Tax=Halomonas korlensis TaxID=463301 RepID=UPI001587695E|nr:MobC family plasmid mobilization relaxosome protein [Halomonas korlensis]